MHAAQCFSRPRRGALVGIASALVMLAGAGSAHAEPHTYQIDAEHFGISFSMARWPSRAGLKVER